jgi:erythronate-4-phosphate dehydrogenase
MISRELLTDANILLVRSITPVNRELLEDTPVKFVASATIGVDHIDTEYLKEKSIGFAYAPGSNAESVAEYVISALFLLSSRMNRPLQQMTLGIVGVGNIGSKVYRCAEALGMRCLLNDPPKKKLTESDIYISLNQIVEESDILTFHVPLITSGEYNTYHLVNHDLIAKMKKDVILINTSRGRVFDEKSIRAERARIGGLVLDVWENEPSINTEIFKITDIGTPHIAGYSVDGKIRGTKMIYDAACAFFFSKPKWQIPDNYLSEVIKQIDVCSSAQPVADAVLNAYEIEQDHKSLSEIVNTEKSEQGKFFDNLRKNYPQRREFSHFLIKCSPSQKREAKIISELGFQIQSQANPLQ